MVSVLTSQLPDKKDSKSDSEEEAVKEGLGCCKRIVFKQKESTRENINSFVAESNEIPVLEFDEDDKSGSLRLQNAQCIAEHDQSLLVDL